MWAERGRCLEPMREPFSPRFDVIGSEGRKVRSVAFAIEFDTCPMALLRSDLNAEGLATARLVQNAEFAGLRSRYPHMSFKLWELLCHQEGLKVEKQREFEAGHMRELERSTRTAGES